MIGNRCKYSKLSLISAIGESGKMVYQIRQGTFNGKSMIWFFRDLLKSTRKKIILIWDGAKVHHCQEVKDFLDTNAGKRL